MDFLHNLLGVVVVCALVFVLVLAIASSCVNSGEGRHP